MQRCAQLHAYHPGGAGTRARARVHQARLVTMVRPPQHTDAHSRTQFTFILADIPVLVDLRFRRRCHHRRCTKVSAGMKINPPLGRVRP